VTDRWQRPKSPWRDDPGFCEAAKVLWPEDWKLTQRGGYDRGACGKMLYRWQGWCARELAERAGRAHG
jgi:hypothetical protein